MHHSGIVLPRLHISRSWGGRPCSRAQPPPPVASERLLLLQISVCCFDKTGTLTSDDMLLDGVVVEAEGGSGSDSWAVVKDPKQVPMLAARALAGCQSLTTLNGRLIGDPLEQAAVSALQWAVSADNTGTVVVPLPFAPCPVVSS